MQACLCVGVCGCGKHFEIWIQMNFCITNEKIPLIIWIIFWLNTRKKTTNHLNMMFFLFGLLACFIPQRSNWMKKKWNRFAIENKKQKFIDLSSSLSYITHSIHHTYTYWHIDDDDICSYEKKLCRLTTINVQIIIIIINLYRYRYHSKKTSAQFRTRVKHPYRTHRYQFSTIVAV